jgi:hypothetical protein
MRSGVCYYPPIAALSSTETSGQGVRRVRVSSWMCGRVFLLLETNHAVKINRPITHMEISLAIDVCLSFFESERCARADVPPLI